MGNKNSSTHLTNHQRKSNYYITNNDEIHYTIDTSSYQTNNNNKKHGPSPRFRRRHARQVHLDKKLKRPQV
jgi:hypothetical protein